MPLLKIYSEILNFQKQPNEHSKTEKAQISEIKNSMDRLNSKKTKKCSIAELKDKSI